MPNNTSVVSHFSKCPRFLTSHQDIVNQIAGINISSGGEGEGTDTDGAGIGDWRNRHRWTSRLLSRLSVT